MDRLFSGLLNSVRRAAAKNGSSSSDHPQNGSSSKSTSKRPTYSSWKIDAAPKIEAVVRQLSPLLQRQERLYEFQSQLKKLNSALHEIDHLLAIDIYEVRTNSRKLIGNFQGVFGQPKGALFGLCNHFSMLSDNFPDRIVVFVHSYH